MIQTYQLTGTARTGIIYSDAHRKIVEKLPTTVKYGYRPAPPYALPPIRTGRFERYFNAAAITIPYPESTNRIAKCVEQLAKQRLNDRFNTCLWNMITAIFTCQSANDSDSPTIIDPTDDETYADYTASCGPGDQGCYMSQIWNYVGTTGLLARGQRYVEWLSLGCPFNQSQMPVGTNIKDIMKAAIWDMGGSGMGSQWFPAGWRTSDTWDVSNFTGPFVAHGWSNLDYTPDGIKTVQHGRVSLMTWAGLAALPLSGTEHVIWVGEPWWGPDKINSATGIDTDGLIADFWAIGNERRVPAIPEWRDRVFSTSIKDTKGKYLNLSIENNAIISSSLTDTEPLPPPPPPPPTVPALPLRIDFGPSVSPIVAPGFIQMGIERYTDFRGFGWDTISVAVYEIPNATALGLSALERDFAYTSDNRYKVNCANGLRTVKIYLGDKRMEQPGRKGMGISVQDGPYDLVDHARGEVVVKTYTANVTTGQLNIHPHKFTDNDPDTNVVICGLEIS